MLIVFLASFRAENSRKNHDKYFVHIYGGDRYIDHNKWVNDNSDMTTYERIHCNDHPISIFVYGDSGDNSKQISYVHYNQTMHYSSQNTQLGNLNSLRLKKSVVYNLDDSTSLTR